MNKEGKKAKYCKYYIENLPKNHGPDFTDELNWIIGIFLPQIYTIVCSMGVESVCKGVQLQLSIFSTKLVKFFYIHSKYKKI